MNSLLDAYGLQEKRQKAAYKAIECAFIRRENHKTTIMLPFSMFILRSCFFPILRKFRELQIRFFQVEEIYVDPNKTTANIEKEEEGKSREIIHII